MLLTDTGRPGLTALGGRQGSKAGLTNVDIDNCCDQGLSSEFLVSLNAKDHDT